jgi:hypothetical protein
MDKQLIKDIQKEIEYSRSKFGAFHSDHEAYAVILEEFDELWDDIKSNSSKTKKYQETIQCIAMLTCYINEVIGVPEL